jgi:hypothetical protein
VVVSEIMSPDGSQVRSPAADWDVQGDARGQPGAPGEVLSDRRCIIGGHSAEGAAWLDGHMMVRRRSWRPPGR